VLVTNVAPKARAAYAEHGARGHTSRRRTQDRARRAHLAAAEAAEDDPAFAADTIEQSARDLFTEIQQAWSRDDRAALAQRISPGLQREWTTRLDDFARRGWRNRVELETEPRAALVGIERSTGTPTATVQIEATLKDYVVDASGRRLTRTARLTERSRIREYWTLARTNGRWILQRIEQGAEGSHALEDQLIATPWADTEALTDSARLETAQTTTAHAGLTQHEPADAHAAALDLSLVDDRFAPDIIDIAVRGVIAQWADAIDQGPHALYDRATPQAAQQLLATTATSRLVIRGPRLEKTTITHLDADAPTPTVTVEAEITARRYRENRATAAIEAGSQTRATRFTQALTFALTDAKERPWQLVAAA
jgi:predicted lipid-binding transport protein (Tim44 family)